MMMWQKIQHNCNFTIFQGSSDNLNLKDKKRDKRDDGRRRRRRRGRRGAKEEERVLRRSGRGALQHVRANQCPLSLYNSALLGSHLLSLNFKGLLSKNISPISSCQLPHELKDDLGIGCTRIHCDSIVIYDISIDHMNI